MQQPEAPEVRWSVDLRIKRLIKVGDEVLIMAGGGMSMCFGFSPVPPLLGGDSLGFIDRRPTHNLRTKGLVCPKSVNKDIF
jgi:hypothetical protein